MNCKHYYPPRDGNTCGKCEYPVPEYLKIASAGAGGSFISMPEYSGKDCAVFSSHITPTPQEQTP